eukprot:c26631_g2_i1 orf=189-1808(+)
MEVGERTFGVCDAEWTRSCRLGWASPRISLSDFVILDDGASPENKERDNELGESEDFSSAGEFEFGIAESVSNNLLGRETMLTADEFFLSGKLNSMESECNYLPLAPYTVKTDVPCSSTRLVSDEITSGNLQTRVTTLPFGFDNGNSGSSSFSARSTAPTKASTFSKRFVQFFKSRKLHKQVPVEKAWKEVPSSSITREHFLSSNCNSSMSTKAIWECSRSSSSAETRTVTSPPHSAPMNGSDSITESKTHIPPPTPPPTSNSAIENMTAYTPVSSNSAIETSCCSRPQGPQRKIYPVPAKQASTACPFSNVDGNACNKFCNPADSFRTVPHGTTRLTRPSSSLPSVASPCSTPSAPALMCLGGQDTQFLSINETVDVTIAIKENAKQSDNCKDPTRNVPARLSWTNLQGDVQRTGLNSPSRTLSEGRSGRRQSSCKSPVRGTSGKTERIDSGRCSAGLNVRGKPDDLSKRGAWTGSYRVSSYSDSIKEATVLNVAVCTFPSITGGKLSQNRLRSCGSFVSKKSSNTSSRVPGKSRKDG